MSRPLGKLLVLRLVLEPLRVYLHEQFRIAGEEFETAQRAQVAAGKGNRKYRLTEYARGAMN